MLFTITRSHYAEVLSLWWLFTACVAVMGYKNSIIKSPGSAIRPVFALLLQAGLIVALVWTWLRTLLSHSGFWLIKKILRAVKWHYYEIMYSLKLQFFMFISTKTRRNRALLHVLGYISYLMFSQKHIWLPIQHLKLQLWLKKTEKWTSLAVLHDITEKFLFLTYLMKKFCLKLNKKCILFVIWRVFTLVTSTAWTYVIKTPACQIPLNYRRFPDSCRSSSAPSAASLQRARCALKCNVALCFESNIRRASVLWVFTHRHHRAW